MKNIAVFNQLQSVITHTLGANVSQGELEGASRLDELVALDSVALLEFAVGIEKEFKIRLKEDQFTREFLTDLPGLLAYLNQIGNGAAN